MVAQTNFPKEELPKGRRNFPSRGERDLQTPTKLHKDSLRKAHFCSRKLFPRELGWSYHLVLSPTRKVFFSLEEGVCQSNLVGISTFFFLSLYNFVEYSKFFSPWATWLDIPNSLLSPKQLGWGYWLVPFSPRKLLPKGN
jgi:hypothetical protein